METTETKYEWQIGKYLARTWFGEYGTHTEWFKGEEFINSDLVPDLVLEAHEQLCEEEGF
jgi:hypothetical protein